MNADLVEAIDAYTNTDGKSYVVVIMASGEKHLVLADAEKLAAKVFGGGQAKGAAQ